MTFISRRNVVTALAVAIVSMVTLADAGPADYLMPVEKHTTPKGQALAAKYRPQLLQFSDYVYHCLPYLEIRNGLGFKRVPKETADDRYASVWIRAEQAPDPSFAALPIERQASAMFSRYAVPMLSRLLALPGLESDPDVFGFSVAVEWIKPNSDPNRPTMEILAMFADKAKFQEIFDKVVPLAIADGLAAVTYVRQHASDWGVSADHVGIIGFSAGGAVTAGVAFHYTPEGRPAFVAPIYADGSMFKDARVPADAPPMFVAAATDDQLGLAPDTVVLYEKWTGAHKSAELHMYAKGGHGFEMRKQNLPTDHWIDRFSDWLELQGWLKK